jgi:broad specificity phosphatase PhoE
MALYLVRHAHAGSRGAWEGDDALRPLSKRGWAQAEGITELVPDDVAAVLSSPATRCVQSVAGAAAKAGVPVEEDAALFEGAPVEPAAERIRTLLRDHPGRDVVVCSHGDLIPELLDRWAADGADLALGGRHAKGSTWVLDTDQEGSVTGGRYVPPVT